MTIPNPPTTNLPTGWVWTPVKAIAELYRGISYKKEEASKEQKAGYKPILRANNINGSLNFDDLVYVPKARIAAYQYIKAGDIIFAMSSGSKNLVGKSAIAQQDFDGSYGAFCALLRATDFINKSYLAYFFQGNDYRKLISTIAKGTNINNLKREHILDLNFPLPPLAEQHRIVAKIEELFSDLDNGVAGLRQARAQLRLYRQAVLKYAFEGQLTEAWRATHKDLTGFVNLSGLAERGAAKTLPPLTPAELAELPGLPEGWRWVKLGEIAEKITDGTHHTPTYQSEGVPFISVKDIYNGQIHFDDCKYIPQAEHKQLIQRCNPERGDLLITKSGTIGRLAIVNTDIPFSLFVSVALIKLKNFVNPKFLSFCLENYINGLDIDQQIKGGVIKNFHLEDLRVAKIPFCSLTEQQRIVSEIEARLSVVEKLEEAIDTGLRQAAGLRQSILRQAFAGRLVGQAAGDEPAGELLARLKRAVERPRR